MIAWLSGTAHQGPTRVIPDVARAAVPDHRHMDTPQPTRPTTAPGPGRPLPPPQPPPWRLLRARRHVLAGVCQGLSVATGVDVTLVRLAFVVVGLTGVGVLAYVLLAVMVAR